MKSIFFILLGCVIVIIVGCTNQQSNDDNKAIAGIWQNITAANAAVEFTANGEYYLRLNGERLLTNDSTVEKYSYNPLLKENNLIIYGNPRTSTTQARLVVISTERIKISLVDQGSIVSEAEFTKVNKE